MRKQHNSMTISGVKLKSQNPASSCLGVSVCCLKRERCCWSFWHSSSECALLILPISKQSIFSNGCVQQDISANHLLIGNILWILNLKIFKYSYSLEILHEFKRRWKTLEKKCLLVVIKSMQHVQLRNIWDTFLLCWDLNTTLFARAMDQWLLRSVVLGRTYSEWMSSTKASRKPKLSFLVLHKEKYNWRNAAECFWTPKNLRSENGEWPLMPPVDLGHICHFRSILPQMLLRNMSLILCTCDVHTFLWFLRQQAGSFLI